MLAVLTEDDSKFNVSQEHPGDVRHMLLSFGEVSLISLLLIETKPVMRRKRRRHHHVPQAGRTEV